MQATLPELTTPRIETTSLHSLQAAKAQRRERRLYWVYVVSLIFAFVPSRELGQFSALVFLGLVIFVAQVRPNFHLGRLFLVGLGLGALAVVYALIEPEIFDIYRYLLSGLTFSAFFLLLLDYRLVATPALLKRIRTVTLWSITIQAGIGFTQAARTFSLTGTFDGSSGDFIWGTLAPLYSRQHASTMPYFALLLTTLLLFCVATQNRRLTVWSLGAYGAVLLIWILASMLHSIVYFVVAVAVCVGISVLVRVLPELVRRFRLNRREITQMGTVAVVVVGISLATAQFLPGNVAAIPVVFERIEFSDTARSFKLRVAYNVVMRVPEAVPLQPLIGVGPGQFNSRAALMTTAEYLRRPLPFIGERVNALTATYVVPYLGDALRARGASSMDFPSSSWIALYAEMGVAGLALVGMLSFYAYRRFLFRRIETRDFPYMQLALAILVTYFLLMGLQSIYWEYTQSVWPAIFGIKLCYDYLGRQEIEQREAEQRRVEAL